MNPPSTSPNASAPPTAPGGTGLPGGKTDWRSSYLRYLKSRQGLAEFKVGTPWISYAVAAPFILSVVAAPVGIGIAFGGMLRASRRKKDYMAVGNWAARAVPIATYPLMVNTALLNRRGVVAPGLVMGCFEQQFDAEYLAALAEMLEIATTAPSNDAERAVKAMFDDERFHPGRRRLMPLEFTQGVPIYAFDLLINSNYLPEQKIAGPLIPCLADPPGREPATIAHIPWFCTMDPRDWLMMMGSSEAKK